MNKRWVTIPLLIIFALINGYWIKNHLELSVLKQIAIVSASTVFYVMAGVVEVFFTESKQERRRLSKLFILGLLAYNLFFISTAVFFDGYFFTRSARTEVNKELFHTIKSFIEKAKEGKLLLSLGNLMGNLILLAPLGMLLPLSHKIFKNPIIFMITVTLSSIGIELLQYRLSIGSADIDDIFLNVCGALGIYVVTMALLWLGKERIETFYND